MRCRRYAPRVRPWWLVCGSVLTVLGALLTSRACAAGGVHGSGHRHDSAGVRVGQSVLGDGECEGGAKRSCARRRGGFTSSQNQRKAVAVTAVVAVGGCGCDTCAHAVHVRSAGAQTKEKLKLATVLRGVHEACTGVGGASVTAEELQLAEARVLVGLRFAVEFPSLRKHLASAVKMLMVPGASLPALPPSAFAHPCVSDTDVAACGGGLLHAATLAACANALVGSSATFLQNSLRHVAVAAVVLASFDLAERSARADGGPTADVGSLPRPSWLASVPASMTDDVAAAMRGFTSALFQSTPRAVLPRSWVSMQGLTPATASWLRAETPADRAHDNCPRALSPSTAPRSVRGAFRVLKALSRTVYLAERVEGDEKARGEDARLVTLRVWPEPRRAQTYGFPASAMNELQRLASIHRNMRSVSDPNRVKRFPYVDGGGGRGGGVVVVAGVPTCDPCAWHRVPLQVCGVSVGDCGGRRALVPRRRCRSPSQRAVVGRCRRGCGRRRHRMLLGHTPLPARAELPHRVQAQGVVPTADAAGRGVA